MFPQRIEFNGKLSSHFGIACIGSISMYTSVLYSVQVCLFLCHKNPFGAFHLIADRFESVDCWMLVVFNFVIAFKIYEDEHEHFLFRMVSIVCSALCNKKKFNFFFRILIIYTPKHCARKWQRLYVSVDNLSTFQPRLIYTAPLSHGAYINSLSNAQNKRRDKKVKLTNEWFVQRRMFMANKKKIKRKTNTSASNPNVKEKK